MGKSPKKPPIAKARFSDIRPYVNFKFDNKPSTARKIRAIHKELNPMLAQPHTVLKARGKKQINLAMEIAGFDVKFKSIKAVPVESLGIPGAKAKFQKGAVFVFNDTQSMEYIPFNKEKLAIDGARHVNELIAPRVAALEKKNKRRKKNKETERYQILAGPHLIKKTEHAGSLAGRITQLQMLYDTGTELSKKHGNSTYRDWMTGVRVIGVNNQHSLDETMNRWKDERIKVNKAFKAKVEKYQPKKKPKPKRK